MGKLRYTFKTDTLFKMLFVKHQDLLKKLVAALLGNGGANNGAGNQRILQHHSIVRVS